MSIYRHKRSPFWQYEFQIEGHRFSGSTRTDDEREAREIEGRKKAEARAQLDEAARTNRGPMTIESACARWWNEHGQDLNDPIKTALDWLVTTIGPRTPLHAITDETVARVVRIRKTHVRRAGREKGRGGRLVQLYRPITARTVNNTTVDLLRRVMRRARDNWNAMLPREPVWKKHRLKETKRPVRELSRAEDDALDSIESAEFIALRRFAEITGLRRRNLLLTWTQVDFELAVVRVISKGGVPRTIPLTREAYAILWQQRGNHAVYVFTYVAQRTRRIPKGRPGENERVKGQRYPITYWGMGSNQRLWKKAGVNARIHDLRHTTGMRTLRKTGNLRIVQKLLGHTDIAITAKFYTDATLEDLRGAMEATAETTTEQLALPAPAKTAEPE